MKQTVTQKTNDLDDVFKSLKNNHTDLFISIINDSFGMHYTKKRIKRFYCRQKAIS